MAICPFELQCQAFTGGRPIRTPTKCFKHSARIRLAEGSPRLPRGRARCYGKGEEDAVDKEIPNPFPRRTCFFCGDDNPDGLRLTFRQDEASGEVFTDYAPEARFAGQGDILHGAIQMGLLDEAMGWACFARTGQLGVTTDFAARFLRPARIAAGRLRVRCRVDGASGRDVRLSGELLDAGGGVCTTATGTYRVLSPERRAALING
jgi:acyl-coenzyme A thioesterase PaaI-like protein